MKKKITPQSEPVSLIYCRVSSDRQKTEGSGLESQEHRCREYAKVSGYKVEAVFPDSASGGGDFMKRPQMRALLDHIDKQPHKRYVVIFDDLKRFARDMAFHIKLRSEFESRGVTLKCLNFDFDDSPMGEFSEGILALAAQLERKQNRLQVIQKMKARLELGYWTFNSTDIPGYERSSHTSRDWILVKKEPEATIVKEALEGYANGRFQHQVDVQEFLERKGFFGNKKRKEVYLSQVNRLLTRIVYAGYIEFLDWDVTRRKGKHEGVISIETYDLIQEKLAGKRRIRIRKDYSSDFPLRPYVRCATCGKLLTSSWSTGRNGRHPYYRCQNKSCEYYGKSIQKSQIEGDFEILLKNLKPKEGLIKLTRAILEDLYDKKHKEYKKDTSAQQRKIELLKEEMEMYMQRIFKTENTVMIERYEEKITQLNEVLGEMESEIGSKDTFEISFGTAMDEVFEVLKNPINKWDSENLEDKRLVIKLIFDGDPTYDKIHGFGTTDLSCVIRLFERIGATNSRDVEMWGIEPQSELGCEGESTVRS